MDMKLAGWTIAFDLDGTLVDTAPDLHAALNHCLTQSRYKPVPFDEIRAMIGQGAKAMIVKGLKFQGVIPTDAELEALWEAFLVYYRAHISDLSAPYPGVLETLETLSNRGATIGVCTNKTQALAEQLLEGLGLSEKFSCIVGADAVAHQKPDGRHILDMITRADGQAERAIMVGDSTTDERAARDAGLPFIFVEFGYGPAPDRTGIWSVDHWSRMLAAILEIVDQAASAVSTGR